MPATIALTLARQARREAYVSGGFLTGAGWLRRGERLAWTGLLLAAVASWSGGVRAGPARRRALRAGLRPEHRLTARGARSGRFARPRGGGILAGVRRAAGDARRTGGPVTEPAPPPGSDPRRPAPRHPCFGPRTPRRAAQPVSPWAGPGRRVRRGARRVDRGRPRWVTRPPPGSSRVARLVRVRPRPGPWPPAPGRIRPRRPAFPRRLPRRVRRPSPPPDRCTRPVPAAARRVRRSSRRGPVDRGRLPVAPGGGYGAPPGTDWASPARLSRRSTAGYGAPTAARTVGAGAGWPTSGAYHGEPAGTRRGLGSGTSVGAAARARRRARRSGSTRSRAPRSGWSTWTCRR